MQNAPFLILSHHRSGSNFLNELIQQHSQFTTINEPLSMHTRFFRDQDLIRWEAADYHPDYLHPSMKDKPQLIEFLKGLRDWLLSPYPSHTRGIKETLLFDKLQWLNRYLPSLKIIFLIRDPRAVAASIMRRNMYDSIWKYSLTIPRYMRAYHAKRLEQPTLPELFIYSWKIRYELARQHSHLFEHQFIRLEDVMRYPERSLSAIMNFLGVEPEEQQMAFLNQSQRETRGETFSPYRASEEVMNLWRQVLSDDVRDQIETALHHEMAELCYM